MIFQKNLGDTDYPSLVISNHTYGMMSLALTSLIISLALNNFYKLSGFFSTLLIGVHPVIGIWIISIMIIVGGLTRLTDSGLSITEWQLFSGFLPESSHCIPRRK